MPKVKIIKGDTLTKISVKKNVSTEVLKALNPGVKTVKAGQVIKVPKNYDDNTPAPKLAPKLGGGMTSTGIVPSFNPLTGNSSVMPINPNIRTPAVMPRVNTQAGGNTPPVLGTQGYTGTAGYWGAYNQPQYTGGGLPPDDRPVLGNQGYLGSSGYLNPAYQTPQNTQSTVDTTVKLTSPRPATVFTGDPDDPNTAAWRAYWNNVAQLGGDPNIPAAAPTVMTREEIWQMKAASRRKKAAGMSEDELGGGGYAPYQYSETTQSFVPEPLARSITWGI